jgi:hypothetical protein
MVQAERPMNRLLIAELAFILLVINACGTGGTVPPATAVPPTETLSPATALPAMTATAIETSTATPTATPSAPATESPTATPTASPTATLEPPTQTPTTIPTETRVPPTPTKVPTKEVLPNYPQEIPFDSSGSKLINRGTRWGVNGVNELKLPDGTPADGVNVIRLPNGTFARGPVARKMAIDYIQKMFQKYGQLPDGGAGKRLVIIIDDKPLGRVLYQTDDYQYYAEQVGNTITAYISFKPHFNINDSLTYDQFLTALDSKVITNFLNGSHEGILASVPINKPPPLDIQNVAFPSKLVPYAR